MFSGSPHWHRGDLTIAPCEWRNSEHKVDNMESLETPIIAYYNYIINSAVFHNYKTKHVKQCAYFIEHNLIGHVR